jgi:hypothetical protein
MNNIIRISGIILGLAMLVSVSGCAPEVGSEKWCAKLQEKPKADWSANELADYTKHCVFK